MRRVAGIGCRGGASPAALADALARAEAAAGCAAEAVAAPADRAALAATLGLPVLALPPAALAAAQGLATASPRVVALRGVGSVAEAAALAACGPGARLLCPRQISTDRTATAAIAERRP